MVEHYVDIVGVTSSNLVPPTMKFIGTCKGASPQPEAHV
ncbi:hypothetical protein BVG79_02027 [Ketogulonicigenium robustum]|uniref:Uncharacterized protein n=1 Tax=Ketogulonicigenium robustum TaxID=92947 RepID=A0A1W6P239_9RHOB|nr:hypothetical protein BVG79_02027 [Ketogulonicigenium robustum]